MSACKKPDGLKQIRFALGIAAVNDIDGLARKDFARHKFRKFSKPRRSTFTGSFLHFYRIAAAVIFGIVAVTLFLPRMVQTSPYFDFAVLNDEFACPPVSNAPPQL